MVNQDETIDSKVDSNKDITVWYGLSMIIMGVLIGSCGSYIANSVNNTFNYQTKITVPTHQALSKDAVRPSKLEFSVSPNGEVDVGYKDRSYSLSLEDDRLKLDEYKIERVPITSQD